MPMMRETRVATGNLGMPAGGGTRPQPVVVVVGSQGERTRREGRTMLRLGRTASN